MLFSLMFLVAVLIVLDLTKIMKIQIRILTRKDLE